MKIVIINGSSKGKDGNTDVLVKSLVKGAQAGGAETRNIFLNELKIEHCKGCHICWTRGPGQCVISDDMFDILTLMGSADVIAFASPVYFGNISGMLKTFMDRMTMIGSPHSTKNSVKESNQQLEPSESTAPQLMMISSCGFSDKSEFDVTSLWINKVAKKMNMKLIGEIYATNGKAYNASPELLDNKLLRNLQLIEDAGKEIASHRKLSAETKDILEQLI
ncbi:flavodoxin family protein [Clostridium aminobutyricum]|uniref:Flavodoxin family protein n=1 Tax=Clostridium aminobutyricum TaxID=33953 RepID=A0A939IHL0_CLOAM|nr:flavodoxin family protein [Clostridium aminobutyricum]MBN7772106.1 flavodoxin family protein [Clostridium aminobutyricum]